jgi:hypothetical protein
MLPKLILGKIAFPETLESDNVRLHRLQTYELQTLLNIRYSNSIEGAYELNSRKD